MTRTVTATPVVAHTLVAEGAAFFWDGTAWRRKVWNSTGGFGVARCACGATSPGLPSRTARRYWHYEHSS